LLDRVNTLIRTPRQRRLFVDAGVQLSPQTPASYCSAEATPQQVTVHGQNTALPDVLWPLAALNISFLHYSLFVDAIAKKRYFISGLYAMNLSRKSL